MTDPLPAILGLGGETKVRLALLSGGNLQNSRVFADLKDFADYSEYRRTVRGFLASRSVRVLACDGHPDYLSTRFALELAKKDPGLRVVQVQHHFSHAVSVLWEHGLTEKTAAVVFDGTGYGDDGHIWGGEAFACDRSSCARLYHLEEVPMPGLDAAVREPWRMAASWAEKLGIPDSHPAIARIPARVGAERWTGVRRMSSSGANSAPTSSMGRLFDAVACLAGLCDVNSTEAEAAIKLERAADHTVTGSYPVRLEGGLIVLDEMMSRLIEDAGRKPAGYLSAVFHNTVARIVRTLADRIAQETGLKKIALSGGVFQNGLLNTRIDSLFEGSECNLLRNRELTATDLNISVGQAVHAAATG